MAKQQTKTERLENLFRQARKDLPPHMFTEFLCFSWGIFEAVARFGRPIKHGDLSIIEKELKGLRNKAGYLEDHLEADRQFEQELRMAGKVV